MTKNNDSHGLTVSTKYDSREIKLRGRRWRRSVRWREFAEVADWFGSSMVYQLEILKLFWKLWIAASLRILPLWESNWKPWRSWLESHVACGLVNKDKHTVWVTGLLKEYCIRALNYLFVFIERHVWLFSGCPKVRQNLWTGWQRPCWTSKEIKKMWSKIQTEICLCLYKNNRILA